MCKQKTRADQIDRVAQRAAERPQRLAEKKLYKKSYYQIHRGRILAAVAARARTEKGQEVHRRAVEAYENRKRAADMALKEAYLRTKLENAQ